jgi:hypothetical protein
MEANREACEKVSKWFVHAVWPNLLASIIWSLPTWTFIFWRFARKFVKEREQLLWRLEEMHKHMDEQHEEIQSEVHRAPPPPPRPRTRGRPS